MKYLSIASLFCIAIIADPTLPDPGPNIRKWIKVNEVEYEVPFGSTPQRFKEQLQQTLPTVSVRTFPQPTTTTPFTQVGLLSGFQRVTQPVSPGGGSFHVGFVPYSPPPSPSRAPWRLPTPPVSLPVAREPAYPRAPLSTSFRSSGNGGSRQWVKLAEGQTPIEVPAGQNPQEFLNGIRLGNRLRFLHGKHGNVVVAPPPPPPPPMLTKVTYQILAPPTKMAFVPPPTKMAFAPTKKGFAPPVMQKGFAPPVMKKGYAPPLLVRPFYVAARPVGKGFPGSW